MSVFCNMPAVKSVGGRNVDAYPRADVLLDGQPLLFTPHHPLCSCNISKSYH